MSIPLWSLLGFAAWTILTLLISVAPYRWSRILTGRAGINAFPADRVEGSDFYRRSMRAHANCVENLPVLTAVIVVALATGVTSSWFAVLSVIYLGGAYLSDHDSYLPAADREGCCDQIHVLPESTGLHHMDGGRRGRASAVKAGFSSFGQRAFGEIPDLPENPAGAHPRRGFTSQGRVLPARAPDRGSDPVRPGSSLEIPLRGSSGRRRRPARPGWILSHRIQRTEPCR